MNHLQLYEILNIITSLLIVAATWKQLQIVLRIDWKKFSWDYVDNTKILFLVFNIAILFGMWLPYLNQVLWSSICFLFAGGITIYTYWSDSIKQIFIKIKSKYNATRNRRS